MKLDLNCDLGEGEPPARTRALMRWITSANVACGGHAGDARTMEVCTHLAKQSGVRLGAHPGAWSREDFGRGRICPSPDELETLLLHQVGALELVARKFGIRLHHIKLHGALYHATERDAALAGRFLQSVRRHWPGAKVYALAGGTVARMAPRWRAVVWEEAFADRAYERNGLLVGRECSGALITDAREIADRVREIAEEGSVRTVAGTRLSLRARTICLHSDTAKAAMLARIIARCLKRDRH